MIINLAPISKKILNIPSETPLSRPLKTMSHIPLSPAPTSSSSLSPTISPPNRLGF